MVAFLFQGLLDSGPLSYLTGISDLDVHMRGGTPVLYATSGASGGITSYRLDGASPALLDREAFGAGEIHATAGGLEQVTLDGGAVMVTLGRQGSGLQYYDLTGSGELATAGQLTAPGGLQAAVVSMETVSVAGTTYAYASHLEMDGLTVYALDGAGQMTLLAQQAQSGQSVSGADLLAVERVEADGQNYLITLSAQGNSVASYRVGADGMLSEVATAGAHNGLAINVPTALAQMQVGGQTYLAVAAAGSSSLSILRLESDGTITPIDHVIDQLDTRFQGVTALEAVSIGDRTFLVAGGGDDGLSLFTLLPDGRLLHLDRIADSESMTLANIAALALDVQDGIIHVFASSQAEAGITHLTVNPGTIGQSYLSGAAGGTVSGSGAGDMLVGGIGNDKLRGQGGDDILIDGAGSDTLSGGDGADVFIFTADGVRDIVEDFELGIDRLDLSGLGRIYSLSQLKITSTSWGAIIFAGDEEIRLYSKDGLPIDVAKLRIGDLVDLAHFPVLPIDPVVTDLVLGGTSGNDVLKGGAGLDTLRGGDGGDRLEGGEQNDQLFGDAGDDTILGGAGDDWLYGGSEADRLYGDAGADTLWGEEGNDTLRGGAGTDLLRGGSYEDVLWGEAGNDEIHGDAGFDILYGGIGNDTLYGGFQRDTLWGGTDDDLLYGDGGNDVAYGEAGNDTLIGGAHNDTLVGGAGDDILLGQGDNDVLLGGSGKDILNGDAGNDTLRGGLDDDLLRGGISEDRLFGEVGNDTLLGNAGFDYLDGGMGDDRLDGGDQADNLLGGGGNDVLFGGPGFDRLFAGDGNDLGYGGTGPDALFGQVGNDRLYGQQGTDRIFGGTGNDWVDGGSENDVLYGGAGFDTLLGSTGNDTMTGNFNADTFIFADFGGGFGQDVITDFAATNDLERIDLAAVSSIVNFADLVNNHMSQAGANVLVDAGGGNTITLLGVSIGDLDVNDFIF